MDIKDRKEELKILKGKTVALVQFETGENSVADQFAMLSVTFTDGVMLRIIATGRLTVEQIVL